MSRRKMQWSSCISPILITLFLIQTIVVVVVANGFNNDNEEDMRMSMELVHRHDDRIIGEMDQVEAIKGFIQRDTFRRERMNQRIYGHINNHRRKDYEMKQQQQQQQQKQQFQMPMHGGRDYNLGEYFVQVKVGTPGQKFWLAADTGSEFTWFNCKYVTQKKHHGGGGHKHKRVSKTRTRRRKGRRVRSKNSPSCDGVFCPHKSHSFEAVKCSSRKCKVELSELFSLSYCPNASDPCLYDISYADGSSAKGFFGTDTITLNLTNGRKGKLHNLTIGCTKSMLNGVTFNENTGGILGLGYAKDSFVDKASLQYGAKFSYCLVDHLSHKNISSYLTFGAHKAKLLSEMKKTELLLMPPFYGVNVIGISIGGQMLKIPSQIWDFNAQGGIIIDSGTTLTGLVIEAYEPVVEALKNSLTKVKKIEGDFGGLDFCFDAKEGFDESDVARLVFHFGGGVRFEPPVKSYIIDVAPQVKCIGFVAINGSGASVIGNILQQNHLWEFDLSQNTIGFAPSACT